MAWTPQEGVGRAEEGDLRAAEGPCHVGNGGVATDDDAGLFNQGGEECEV